MKILLAVDLKDDPRVVSAYMAERFDHRNADVDVLTVVAGDDNGTGMASEPPRSGEVIYHPRFSDPAQRSAHDHVLAIAQLLRSRHGFTSVRPHVQCGPVAGRITRCADRWDSKVIVIGEPRQRGGISALRRKGVASSLLQSRGCPVELMRPQWSSPRSLFNVVMLWQANEKMPLPVEQLRALPWECGDRLRLIHLQATNNEARRLEASPAAVIAERLEGSHRAALASKQLGKLTSELSQVLHSKVDIRHEVVTGRVPDDALAFIDRSYASMLILPVQYRTAVLSRAFGRSTAMAFAMRAKCPVLAIREHAPAEQPDPRGLHTVEGDPRSLA